MRPNDSNILFTARHTTPLTMTMTTDTFGGICTYIYVQQRLKRNEILYDELTFSFIFHGFVCGSNMWCVWVWIVVVLCILRWGFLLEVYVLGADTNKNYHRNWVVAIIIYTVTLNGATAYNIYGVIICFMLDSRFLIIHFDCNCFSEAFGQLHMVTSMHKFNLYIRWFLS